VIGVRAMNHQLGLPDPPRAIRLFISSTFLDLQAEREELIKRVFPELRANCELRGVSWGEVDLRWGITAAEAEEGRVLQVCLDEIDECRPFFMAILGERYGWVPETIDPELIQRHPWLAGLPGRSVTELEILHGALQSPSSRALFYIRDPTWLSRLPEGTDRSRFESTDPEARRRLVGLKQAIQDSGFPVRSFADATALGQLVRDDVTALIEELFPPVSALNVRRHAAAQGVVIERLARAHVGRGDELAQLRAHSDGKRDPGALAVSGEPGAGKSSLLAAWVTERTRAARNRAGCSCGEPTFLGRWLRAMGALSRRDEFTLAHFIGASSEGLDAAGVLCRLIEELGSLGDFRTEIPDDPVGLASAFASSLHQVAGLYRRGVLVLDGLDQLDRRSQGQGLPWLPDVMPRGIRLVVSAGPGPVLDELTGRGWPVLHLMPMDRAVRHAFVVSYLWQNHRKKLDEPMLNVIASAERGANAQFLQTLIEEVRATARGIEDLTDLIADHAAAETLELLFTKVLGRLEREFDGGCRGIVKDVMNLLVTARHGLGDAELLDLVEGPQGPMAALDWAPLRHSILPYMVSRSGLLAPLSPALGRAIRRRYLAGDNDRAAVHQKLADYFGTRPVSPRSVEERPWHLAAVGDWYTLARLIATPDFLGAAWPVHRFEITSYWSAVESRTEVRMVETLKGLIADPERHPKAAWTATQLLADSGHRTEALRLALWWVRHGGAEGRAAALDLVASLALELGDLETALEFSERQEREAIASANLDARVAALARQAAAHRRRGALERAEDCLREAERAAPPGLYRTRLPDLLGQRARLLEARSNLAAALRLTERRALLYRQLGDLVGLQDCLGHQGRLLARLRRSARALKSFSEQEAIARRLNDRAGLQGCLGDQIDVLIARRRLDEAVSLLDVRESLCRDGLDPGALCFTILQRAVLFGVVMKRTRLGLDLVESARELAAEHGLAAGVAKAEVVRENVLAAALKNLP
jgi:tetratricopeptide (TPR) repeat protein